MNSAIGKMAKIAIVVAFVMLIAIVLWSWWHFSFDLFIGWVTGKVLLAIGRLLALLAVTIMLTQVTIISRAPWLERWYGHDRLTRAHRIFGIIAFCLIIGHPFLVTIAYAKINLAPYISTFFDTVLHVEDVINALIGYVLLIVIVGTSLVFVRRRVTYETWYFIHLAIYAVFLLSFGHQLNQGNDARSLSFTLFWYALYAFAFGNLILFRFLRPIYRWWRYRFRVVRTEPGNSQTTSVYISGRNLRELRIEPGQFMIVRFLKKNMWYEAHPFSVSKVPAESSEGEASFRLTIKASGDYTRDKVPSISIGTEVLIDGPLGIFTDRVRKYNKVLLIAGGIGITPIRSLIGSWKHENIDMELIYAVREESDIVFRNEFDTIARLKARYLVGTRIDREIVKETCPDILDRDIYLCGPPPMMDGVIVLLRSLNVEKQYIHFEKFNFATK